MAVTVSCVSVVDRMVSKENVQTARPYDRDLASPGAWIETGLSSRDPRWVTVTASFARLCPAPEYSRTSHFQRKKNYAFAHDGACLPWRDVAGSRLGILCSKIEHRELSDPTGSE